MNAAAKLQDAFLEALRYDWRSVARSDQLAPEGDWLTWFICAGRGYGKTRCGAEWVRENVCGDTPLAPGRFKQVALIGETSADCRDVLVGEGKAPGEGSGLLQVCPPDFRPTYEKTNRRLTFPNGAVCYTYSGDEPDQLRGPQHDAAWCDELAKWSCAQEAWDNLSFGLRLKGRDGTPPRSVITTTPRPLRLLKSIMEDPSTIVTRGRTMDNAGNLPPTFLATLDRRYGGTRLGRQELEAELLFDVPGAFWTHDMIEALRVSEAPPLRRIVISVDPAVTSGENADETGIVVAGVTYPRDGSPSHGYVLEDRSGRYTPEEWGRLVISLYRDYSADRVIAEVNNGGDLVENVLRASDRSVSYKAVRASRGKAVRAEPVAALYEQGRVHHVGLHKKLEDQMTVFTADLDRRRLGYSPDRVDALVWALSELMVDGAKRPPMRVSAEAVAMAKAFRPDVPGFGFGFGMNDFAARARAFNPHDPFANLPTERQSAPRGAYLDSLTNWDKEKD